jgi:hypothetical protein
VPVLIVVALLAGLSLAACGGTPTATPPPTATNTPIGTARPTFTPTSLSMATEAPTETAEVPREEPTATTSPQTTPTEEVAGEPTAEASPTPPENTPTPAATRAAGPPPSLRGTLIFPVFEPAEQTYQIYQMDLASGERQLLIAEGSQPEVSLAGNWLSWRSWKQEQRGLLSEPLGGGDIWPMIPFTEAGRPAWAPDGQRFVFPSRQEPDRQSRLYLYTGMGEELFIEIQRHGSPIIGRAPDFLPDGRIVYQGCIENACGLFVMNDDGANPQQISLFKDDTAPAVSPDGSQIAYMSKISGYWQVNVVNADGNNQHSLTDDWYWNGLPTWSPDGRYIVFVSTRDENWPDTFVEAENNEFRLWIMDADGGNQRPLDEEFTFRVDGLPATAPAEEAGGWIEERMIWLPAETGVE